MVNTSSQKSVAGVGSLSGVGSGLKTGAAGNIGAGTEYHVDMKFKDLVAKGDWKKITEIVDTMSKQYESRGLDIEFCNDGKAAKVGGKKWDHNASQEDKIALAKKAVAAHDHNPATTGFSMDFFIVPDGKNRFDKGIKNQELALALPVGGSVKYLTGGGYGANAKISDKDGKELYVIGHGDTTKPLPKNFTFTGEGAAVANASTDPAKKPSSASTSSSKIPTPEEVKEEVEKKGSKKTYEDMMAGFGQQDGGGFVGMLLFLVVMAASGKKNEQQEMAKYQDEKQRADILQKIDTDRSNGKSQTQANAQLKSGAGNLDVSIPSLSKLEVANVATNSPPTLTPQNTKRDKVAALS